MTDHNRLAHSTPEAQGMPSSAVLAFIEAVEEQISELHSFILVRHGVVIAEGGWSPYDPAYPHMLYSLSKSFTSTAIGMAIAEGYLTLDDRVLSFFPDDAPPQVSEALDAMQVRHLLSMSTGHAEDTTAHLHNRKDGRWIAAFLSLPVAYTPGTHFLYNTGATYILSAIIQQTTGMTLLDYLQPRLFEPLGIRNPTWEMSPEGICTGGYGLSVTTEDIACFGQLYLQKGRWNGRQLIPETWVEQASTRQINNGSDEHSDWEQGYGYQFWRCRHGAYRGDGAFGQYCIIMPEQEAVLAITSGLDDMQAVLNLVWEHLLPAMSAQTPLPEQPQSSARLAHKLGSLAYQPLQGQPAPPIAAQVPGKTFVMASNPLNITAAAFAFSEDSATLTLGTPTGDRQIIAGIGAWHAGECDLFPFHNARVVTSGAWQDEQTFVLMLRFIETPHVHTLTCRFEEDRLVIEGEINVFFEEIRYTLTGQSRP